MDLLIGALLGFFILVKGLNKGELHSSAIIMSSKVTPASAVEVFNVTQLNSTPVNSIHLPLFVTECSTLGIWQSRIRTWFLGLYIFGIVLGILIIVGQYADHWRRQKKHLKTKTDDAVPQDSGNFGCEECGCRQRVVLRD